MQIQTDDVMEETVRRGQEWQKVIEPLLPAEARGKYIVIDVDSGDYEIDRRSNLASDRLEGRRPAMRGYTGRVGHETTLRIGFRR